MVNGKRVLVSATLSNFKVYMPKNRLLLQWNLRSCLFYQLYRYFFIFPENSVKMIQNFKEKGVAAAPSAHP